MRDDDAHQGYAGLTALTRPDALEQPWTHGAICLVHHLCSWPHDLGRLTIFCTAPTDNVTNKVGSNWSKTIAVEKGTSTMCSAMYSGSQIERSFSTLANEGVGSLKRM